MAWRSWQCLEAPQERNRSRLNRSDRAGKITSGWGPGWGFNQQMKEMQAFKRTKQWNASCRLFMEMQSINSNNFKTCIFSVKKTLCRSFTFHTISKDPLITKTSSSKPSPKGAQKLPWKVSPGLALCRQQPELSDSSLSMASTLGTTVTSAPKTCIWCKYIYIYLFAVSIDCVSDLSTGFGQVSRFVLSIKSICPELAWPPKIKAWQIKQWICTGQDLQKKESQQWLYHRQTNYRNTIHLRKTEMTGASYSEWWNHWMSLYIG